MTALLSSLSLLHSHIGLLIVLFLTTLVTVSYAIIDCLETCSSSFSSSSSSSTSSSSSSSKTKEVEWEVEVVVGSSLSYISHVVDHGSSSTQEERGEEESASFKLMRRLPFHLSIAADISIPLNITIDTSYFGRAVNVTYDKIRLKARCQELTGPDHLCPRCGGKKFLSASSYSDTDCVCSRIPCPLCIGTGVAFHESCRQNPFDKVTESREIVLPIGVTPGFKETFKGEGNTVFDDHGLHNGDMTVVVEAYLDADDDSTFYIDKNKGSLVYNIPLSPEEMLFGFNKSVPFINLTEINIDRIGKITLPKFDINIPYHGPPIVTTRAGNGNSSGSSSSDLMVDSDGNRDGIEDKLNLTLRFVLEPDRFNQANFSGTVYIDGNTTLDSSGLQELLDRAGNITEYNRLKRLVSILSIPKLVAEVEAETN